MTTFKQNSVQLLTPPLTAVLQHRHGDVWYSPDYQVAVLKCTTSYLPYTQFQEFLGIIENLSATSKVHSMILDKSSLRIFHQPSMEWYHVVWKQRMLDTGLLSYWKVLPEGPLFMESVKIGRERIIRENPDFQYEKFNIRYVASLQEAWANVTSGRESPDREA